LYYFIPCVFKENTIAVLALSRKDSGKLLSSEDMALLTAVAGQKPDKLLKIKAVSGLGLKGSSSELLDFHH